MMIGDGPMKPLHISCGILRLDEKVLLVRARHAGANSRWQLPGGGAEPGETVLETLRREVYEEAGLRICEVGRLVFVSELRDPAATAFVFEIVSWTGDVVAADPDGDVVEARFMAIPDAVEILRGQPCHFVRTPLADYLSRPGEAFVPYLCYVRDPAGDREVADDRADPQRHND